LTVFDEWYSVGTNSVPIVKNCQKTVKTAKMTIGVPIVLLPLLAVDSGTVFHLTLDPHKLCLFSVTV